MTGTATQTGLLEGFCASAELRPELPALEVGDETVSYGELDRRAGAVARAIVAHEPVPRPLVALLAARSAAAYAGVLGILGAGRGYVPLNPQFPVARTRIMFELSGCATLVCGDEAVDVLDELLAQLSYPVTVICPGPAVHARLAPTHTRHAFVRVDAADAPLPRDLVRATLPEATAYLLFTSGSTGVPKGVAVSHHNVTGYLDYVCRRYGFTPDDRCSQSFDLTFDLSVHDMFVCWSSGACLVVLPQPAVMAPARFIRERRLTVWFSVPSVIMFLQRLRALRVGAFPDLRVSLFCGEPLLAPWAEAWQAAAPNAIVENLYGPTEATIAIAHYRWDPVAGGNRCANGVVPIGSVFPTQQYTVMSPEGVPVAAGAPGELWLGGSQVTRGYLNNPEKTREQYVTWGPAGQQWYRTGDRVSQDEAGVLQYLGRIDHQVQILGYRVEMQEVDHAIRTACGNDSAVAVAWPVEAGRADAVYAFVCGAPGSDPAPVLAECQRRLPAYMVPRRVFFLETMPLNANGKIDRAALGRMVPILLT